LKFGTKLTKRKAEPMRWILLILLASHTITHQASADDASSVPNVLFIIADDASSHFGAYGCNWAKTPNIDGLAARGLVFENAYTPTAKCAPSRSSILTGRNPWQLEAAANHQAHFPPHFKVFTEAMSEAGYYVGAQGKFWGPGDAQTLDGKPRTWGLVTSGGESHQDDGGAKFRSFLTQRPEGKPFFFWFGSTNPHRGYEPDSGLAAGKKPSDVDHVPAYWPDSDVVRRDMLDYAIEIELYDRQVGSVLKALEESGETDNTLVVVTSDHGMPFPRVKGHNYDLSNRVPMIACWPRGIQSPGRRVKDFVSLIAMAPTFLEVMHLDPEKAGIAPITGASLTDIFRDQPSVDRSIVIIGRERNDAWARPGSEAGLGYPVRGIRIDKWLYLHNFEPDRWPCGDVELGLLDTDASPTKTLISESDNADRYWQFCFGKRPQEELFDLSVDPDCVNNLTTQSAYRDRADSMQAILFSELMKQQDPRVLGQGEVFDNYPTAKRKASDSKAKKAAKKGS
jgi:arylsulfatase A-like enzyme